MEQDGKGMEQDGDGAGWEGDGVVWDRDGAGWGDEGCPCATAHLCMSATSLVLFQFHLEEAIWKQPWVWQQRLQPFRLDFPVLPVGKSQYWTSQAKPAAGFSHHNQIKAEASGAAAGEVPGVGP